jgi:outer membrane protein assembly factor BamE (lipoprotein component of BamABCDE complex)
MGNFSISASVNDLNKCSAYSKIAVQYLSNSKIINGDSAGNFNPKKEVTRAEFVTMLVNILGIDTSKFEQGYANNFKDVSENHWAKKYILAAQQYKLVSGVSQDNFNPDGKVTREQMATILSQTIVSPENQSLYAVHRIVNGLIDKSNISNWAKNGVEIVMASKMMEGTAPGFFSPKSYATKEQAAVVLYKYLETKQLIDKNLYLYQRNLKPSAGNYFTLGSSHQELDKVMGKNTGNQNILVDTEIRVTGTEDGGIKTQVTTVPKYYVNIVSFGKSEVYLIGAKVIGWMNAGNLKVNTGIPQTNIRFKYGSSKEELFESMGTPKELLMVRNKVYATYKEGFIELENNKVISWVENNKGGLRLDVGAINPNSSGFYYDSSFEEVVKAMGAPPMLFKDDNQIVLQYGKSFVYLYENMKVKHWTNKGELKLGTMSKDENAPPFSFGATRGEVIKAMGLPDSISDQDTELRWGGVIWSYGNSRIHFSTDFLVDGWLNKGNLKLPVIASRNMPVKIGMTKQEVMDAYGPPDFASPYFYTIKYGNSTLNFFNNATLSEIINTDKNIRISQYDNSTNQDFTIDTSLDEVLASMGHPDKMDKYFKWIRLYYGNSELCFIDNKLVGYTNKDNNLRVNLGSAEPNSYFSMYSTLDQLTDAMGTPDSYNINAFGELELMYDKSLVVLNSNKIITSWNNESNNLRLDKSVSSENKITFGTPLEEALKIMGAPDNFGDVGWIGDYGESYSYKMKYGKSLLLAGRGEDGKMSVLGWVNAGELKLAYDFMPQEKQSIRLGNSMDKVISLKGLPNILSRKMVFPSYLYSYTLVYDKTRIVVDDNGKVSEIYNGNNDILLFDDSPKLPLTSTVDFNATRQEIRNTLGDPIYVANHVWEFSNGLRVNFNDQGKISSFDNNKGSISMGERQSEEYDIGIGSTLEEVIKAYGSPECYITYDASGVKLILIFNAYGDDKFIYQGKAYGRIDIDIDYENKVKYINALSAK